jgi:hypothetical protein
MVEYFQEILVYRKKVITEEKNRTFKPENPNYYNKAIIQNYILYI